MSRWRVPWNPGIVTAGVLMIVGCGLMISADEEQRGLRNVGFGIVILAAIVYLVARVLMLVREHRS